MNVIGNFGMLFHNADWQHDEVTKIGISCSTKPGLIFFVDVVQIKFTSDDAQIIFREKAVILSQRNLMSRNTGFF